PKRPTIRAVVIKKDQLITGGEKVNIDPKAKNIEGRDIGIPKALVIERHRGTGNMGIGFVKGLGIKRGALATTIAHDSHNLIALGMTDDEILLAIETLRRSRGGMAVIRGREILAHLPLPVGGLISSLSLEEVARRSRELEEAVKSLGVTLPHPFMYMSFLALPVIPELRITDRGLFDVTKRKFISLFD
ncbi:MAG: adenine deaminase, partial [Deltaproteobacteria bacterium]